MENFFKTLFFVLSILIYIGDVVRFFLTAVKQLVFFVISVIARGLIIPAVALVWVKRQVRRVFNKRRLSQKKRIAALSPRHTKPVVIYPMPLWLKLRYVFLGSFLSFLFIFTPLSVTLFLEDLPNPNELTLRHIPQTTRIVDRNGTFLYQLYATQNRTLVPLETIPKHLQNATIAIEDKDFYRHFGFDMSAIIRSAIKNISGEGLQGGSTITQQLIKSALLTPQTSMIRKVKEVILAFWAERLYTKKQILEMYFNQIPYGGTAWGAQAASDVYFGKSVSDLTLAECAFLAGIAKAPSLYSPFGEYPNRWKKRQQDVLRRMYSLGYITKQEKDEAQTAQLKFKDQQVPIHAPHFVMYVRNLLIQKYGLPMVERGGLTVTTSLDLPLQEAIQKIVADEVAKNTHLNLSNGAALISNPKNGDILVMVGSKDYEDPQGGNVNITLSQRQPGSSIKVVTYSAALAKGYTATTLLDDSPITYTTLGTPPYSPVNYDGKFHGKITLRLALGNSLNVPAVRILHEIGIPTMVTLGKDMGITSWGDPKDYGLSITLGAAEVSMLDLTTVYGVLANGGARVPLNPILSIIDYKGEVIEKKDTVPAIPVLDPGVAFIISDILADNTARAMEFGTTSPLLIPSFPISVKTGTSDNKRDNWTIGYTNNRVVTVWVGNNDNSPMSQNLASGITGAAPIWHAVMERLLTSGEKPTLAKPDNIVKKSCNERSEYFIAGTENVPFCLPTPLPQQIAKPTEAPRNQARPRDIRWLFRRG